MSNLISTAVSVFPRGPKQVKLQKSITFLFIKKKKMKKKMINKNVIDFWSFTCFVFY